MRVLSLPLGKKPSILLQVTLWSAVLIGVIGLAGPAWAVGIVSNARVIEGETGLRFEMEISDNVQAKIRILDKPSYRIVIDLPTVEFRVPQGTGLQRIGTVKEFRFGLVGQNRARIVIDVDGPTLAGPPRLSTGVGGSGVLFSMDLLPTDKATLTAQRAPATPKVKLAAADPIGIVPKPKPADPRQNRPLVIIDPGHGGPDSGAVSPTGLVEKNIVLAIAKTLRDKLNARDKYKVLMTRDTDIFISLKGRVDFAQENRANLFISIHADSTARGKRWQKVSGGTVYSRAERATDEQSRLLALKENAADQMAGEELPDDEGDTVSSIGADLARQQTKGFTHALARKLVGSLRQAVPMTPQAHRQAAFYVLRSPEVPSVLVETGYVNNRSDATNLASPEWRDEMADAIAAGIDDFFAASADGNGLATIFGLDEIPTP